MLQNYNLSIFQIITICALVGLAGFVDSIAGGGGLISLPAYLMMGIPPYQASATNKLSAFMGANVSFFKYRSKGFVKLYAIPCCILAVIFAMIGARLQTLIPESYLKIIIMIALPITMIIVFNKKVFDDVNEKEVPDKKQLIIVFLISIIMGLYDGLYDGLYGPGTGTFLLIFFTKVAKIKLNYANGVSKAINLATNTGSLIYFLYSGKTIIILGILAGCCNMIGSFIGSNLFIKKGANITRVIVLIVISLFALKTFIEIFH